MGPARQVISGVLVAGLGAAIWLATLPFPELDSGYPGPALFPRAIAIGLILSAAWLLAGARGSRTPAFPAAPVLVRCALCLGCVCTFPLLHSLLGSAVAAGLVAAGVGLLFGIRLLHAAATGAVVAVAVQLLFVLLLGVA